MAHIPVETNYEYTPNLIGIQTDILEKSSILLNNFATFQADFSSPEWTYAEMDHIARELEETGKYFAKLQGFKDTPSIGDIELNTSQTIYAFRSGMRFNTGNLIHHIKAERKGNRVVFYNDATNERGQPYAAHMEYGFHDRGGNFIPARPFMRPAWYAVSNASRGRLIYTMKDLIERAWTDEGFNGLRNLQFGHSKAFNMEGYSVVGKMSNFFSTGRLSQIKNDNVRANFSAIRGLKNNSSRGKTGSIRRDSRATFRGRKQFHTMGKRGRNYSWSNPEGYMGGSKWQQDVKAGRYNVGKGQTPRLSNEERERRRKAARESLTKNQKKVQRASANDKRSRMSNRAQHINPYGTSTKEFDLSTRRGREEAAYYKNNPNAGKVKNIVKTGNPLENVKMSNKPLKSSHNPQLGKNYSFAQVGKNMRKRSKKEKKS